MKYVNLLLAHNIKPILVFDGRNLPSKSETEKKRRQNRKENKEKAVQLLSEGKMAEAREYFQRCVDVTPAMARDVIQAGLYAYLKNYSHPPPQKLEVRSDNDFFRVLFAEFGRINDFKG